jgi:hypothetical protein
MSWATTDPLELLLRPLDPAVFLAEHWARRPGRTTFHCNRG